MTTPLPLSRHPSGPPSPLRHILVEMMQGYREAAVLLDAQGQALHRNAAAQHMLEASRDVPGDALAAKPQEWPHRISFSAGGDEVYTLAVSCAAHEDAEAATPLPPRLAKIARLVVAGLTDKQIASRTGLSFSTVRTYVRQIYRRTHVHSRVGLVHVSNAGNFAV